LINDELQVTVIDFPQMVSTSHPNALDMFCHDVECVRTFFFKKFRIEFDGETPAEELFNSIERKDDLDIQLKASGWRGSKCEDEGEEEEEERKEDDETDSTEEQPDVVHEKEVDENNVNEEEVEVASL
jgi:RIO kinase 2